MLTNARRKASCVARSGSLNDLSGVAQGYLIKGYLIKGASEISSALSATSCPRASKQARSSIWLRTKPRRRNRHIRSNCMRNIFSVRIGNCRGGGQHLVVGQRCGNKIGDFATVIPLEILCGE